jgi:hypothetical protein
VRHRLVTHTCGARANIMSCRKRARSAVATTPVTAPGAPPPLRKITVSGGTAMPARMVDMWRQNTKCDAIVKCADGRDFPVHQPVLMACSDFFYATFTSGMEEAETARLTLPDIKAAAVEATLEFVYCGECEVAESDLPALLSASAYLQTNTLTAAVAAKMQERLEPHNCLAAWALADMHSLTALAGAAKDTVLRNFEALSESLVELPHGRLLELLTDEDLVTEREEAVHEAVARWAHAQHPAPTDEALLPLFSTIRYPLVARDFFQRVSAEEPLLQGALGAQVFRAAFVVAAYGPRVTKRRGFCPARPQLTWSATKKGRNIVLSESNMLASAGDMGQGQSVRTAESLPATGKHLVELVFEGEDEPSSRNLAGGNMVGVISSSLAQGNFKAGIWMLAEATDGFWGVDDRGTGTSYTGIRRGVGGRAAAPDEAIIMTEAGRVIFFAGDRVGLLVDRDARTLTMLRNGEPIPSLVFDNLPAGSLFVAATPFHRSLNSSVRIVRACAPE